MKDNWKVFVGCRIEQDVKDKIIKEAKANKWTFSFTLYQIIHRYYELVGDLN